MIAHMNEPRIDTYTTAAGDIAEGFYVADTFAATMRDALIGGPFETAELAEKDRRERNIADDCEVIRVARHCDQCGDR